MRARLEIDDLLALGAGQLAFTSREGATMRLAALTRARQIVADAR
jgi:hypothetical protein